MLHNIGVFQNFIQRSVNIGFVAVVVDGCTDGINFFFIKEV